MVTILKNPKSHYSETDARQSVENAAEIERLRLQTPEIMRQYAELGEATAAAQDRLDNLKKRRAGIAEIQQAGKELQQAIWKQDAVKHNHSRRISELQCANEALSRDLRNDAHGRWLDELRGLVSLRRVETVKVNHNSFSGTTTEDVLTNSPVIEQAKGELLAAIGKIGKLQNADIPTIQDFITSFESELAQIDLSKLSTWDDVPQSRVNDLKEQPADGSIARATLMPDGKVWVHPEPADPKVKALGDRITKLEMKGKK